ncbi:MAG: hypothetical protein IPL25_14340 [Saprospiraceae bacterium]|nr:hypothetical protein [Candidatus Vicinibacter affinis]
MKILYKLNRKDKKYKQRTANTGLAKVAIQCSTDTFVVNHPPAGELRINTCLPAGRCVVKIATFAKPKTLAVIVRQPSKLQN